MVTTGTGQTYQKTTNIPLCWKHKDESQERDDHKQEESLPWVPSPVDSLAAGSLSCGKGSLSSAAAREQLSLPCCKDRLEQVRRDDVTIHLHMC